MATNRSSGKQTKGSKKLGRGKNMQPVKPLALEPYVAIPGAKQGK
ncbi:MAG TPA: hypothetical protein VJN21_11940 [Candidatus Acidoferrales bacterium]|nr:hypothetical protein [Candidatus Acidoferrales bacterium]